MTTAYKLIGRLYMCFIQHQVLEVLSDSLGLVDFPVGLVDSVHHLPTGQAKFLGKIFEEIQITDIM